MKVHSCAIPVYRPSALLLSFPGLHPCYKILLNKLDGIKDFHNIMLYSHPSSCRRVHSLDSHNPCCRTPPPGPRQPWLTPLQSSPPHSTQAHSTHCHLEAQILQSHHCHLEAQNNQFQHCHLEVQSQQHCHHPDLEQIILEF